MQRLQPTNLQDQFLSVAPQILNQNTGNKLQVFIVDILLLPEKQYARFWSELAFELNTTEANLKKMFQQIFVNQYLVKPKAQNIEHVEFMKILVNTIYKQFGVVPGINDIHELVQQKEEKIWKEMQKQFDAQNDVALYYHSHQEFKVVHSYKLSQEDKQLLLDINKKYIHLLPNQVLNKFEEIRQSNYQINRKKAVMFIIHNRLKQKIE
ncbi:Hypothetical_protein [Hexamita inflata]|uniref:Hypothetical_protein n=1 Tax=Hexamita inflata TaxID=28002 RepID=A0AA86QWW8_9EUKA|nr:Hypothetical protein HINF_LOCUS55204 [Hexamita inflata]